MNRYSLSELQPGTRFDAVLMTPDGLRLVPPGTRLTRERIDRLRDWGVEAVETEAEPRGPEPSENGPSTQEPEGDSRDGDGQSSASEGRTTRTNYTPEVKHRCEEGYREALSSTRKLLKRLARGTVEKRMDLLRPLRPLHPLLEEWPHLLFTRLVDESRVGPDQDYIFPYSLNTAIVSMMLGGALGLDTQEVRRLGAAALIHDVGMLKIPAFLRRTDRELSEEDRRKIRDHLQRGRDALSNIDHLWSSTRRVATEHHIQVDGSGYPKKDPESTHVHSRIVNLSMSFVAITQPRPYRSESSFHTGARTVLHEQSRKFDPDVREAFLEQIGLYPPGSLLRLSTGELAVSLWPDPRRGDRPVVLLLTTPDDGRRTEPLLQNLGQDDQREVERVARSHGGYSAMDLV